MCASLASIFLATTFAVNTMPETAHDDTEVVTNHSFSAICFDSRVFSFTLELDASSSNNVEVAFGRDADGDGVLSRFEATMRVGWDCGVTATAFSRASRRRCASDGIAASGRLLTAPLVMSFPSRVRLALSRFHGC